MALYSNDPVARKIYDAIARLEDLHKRVQGLLNSPTISSEVKENLISVSNQTQRTIVDCTRNLINQPKNINENVEPSAGPSFNPNKR